jgi:gluconolactonase
MKKILIIVGGIVALACGCKTEVKNEGMFENEQKIIGEVIKVAPELDQVIDAGAGIELLAEGFEWTEGPLWIEDGGYLLFSDIPKNSIYKWMEEDGVSLYLKPSGYTGKEERGGETGSNALLLNDEGSLVLCQHGDRRLATMDAPLSDPTPNFTTLADAYQDMKFNSPNDATFDGKGNLYFTDPPYGLEKMMDDPLKEIPFQGVYRLLSNGQVELITKDLERPNGIALSNDGKKLYVANSYSERPIIMSFPIDEDGTIGEGEVFFDAKPLKVDGVKGSPDGMKISQSGIIFATGPGGILVIEPSGKHLGTISTGESVSNCALDAKEDYLYATSDMYLVRIKLKGKS